MSGEKFTLPAFAKINPSLHVLGRRPDGYHEIRTIFQTITLRDELTFGLSEDGQLHLSSDSADVPTDESNLISRAAQLLKNLYQVKEGARIELRKKIPTGAGLGGGSSDAAVALLGLAHLWQIKIDRETLANLGARLGADVPFFLTGGRALGTGTGTEIKPLADTPLQYLIVVKPGVKSYTAEAYKALNAPALTKVGGDIILSISRAEAQNADSQPDALHNDFEQVVFHMQPEIKRAKDALCRVQAGQALMSGSGASVFGIFENREAQARARVELEKEFPQWSIFSCETLARGDYIRALGVCAAPLQRMLSPFVENDPGA